MKLLASQIFLLLVIETLSQNINFPDRGSPVRETNQCPIDSRCMAHSICPFARRPRNGPQCRYNGRYSSRAIGICCSNEIRTPRPLPPQPPPPRPPVVFNTAASDVNTINGFQGSRYLNRARSNEIEQCSRGSRCTAYRGCPPRRRPRVITDCYRGGSRRHLGICCVEPRKRPASEEIPYPRPFFPPTTTSTTTTSRAIAPPSDLRECGKSKVPSGLMIGGSPAGQGLYPWMVAITTQNIPDCTATLIDRTHVLTAAHCFTQNRDGRVETSQYDLRIGNVNQRAGESYTIRNLAIHDKYVAGRYYYDVAVITLDRPVTSPDFMPICLPDAKFRNYTKKGVSLAGWGSTVAGGSTSDILMQLTGVPVVSIRACNAVFANRGGRSFEQQFPAGINKGFICAGFMEDDGRERDSCGGDSGGPMMRAEGGRFYEIGILSFGHPKCGAAGFPAVYTRVSSVMDFIERNL